MRTLLNVIDYSNETESNDQMMGNGTVLYANGTIMGTEECGIWNEEYELINSTIQVRKIQSCNANISTTNGSIIIGPSYIFCRVKYNMSISSFSGGVKEHFSLWSV